MLPSYFLGLKWGEAGWKEKSREEHPIIPRDALETLDVILNLWALWSFLRQRWVSRSRQNWVPITFQPPKEPVARRNGGGTICLVQAFHLASFSASCFLENVCLPVSLGTLKNEIHIHSSLREESKPNTSLWWLTSSREVFPATSKCCLSWSWLLPREQGA